MNVKFTPDNVLNSRNKGANKMFEKDVILAICDMLLARNLTTFPCF